VSSDKPLVALQTLARRTFDTISKQSFRVRRPLADPRRRGTHHRPVSDNEALPDVMSIEHFIRGYFVPSIVSVSIGFMAIADGLAVPGSATLAVLVGLGIHMAMQIRHR
jgi:hypothetical protein